MAQVRRGCAPLALLFLIGAAVGGWYGWKWYKKRLPPEPSGGELRVHVLDVGQGDAILVLGPEDPNTKQRKTLLIDAGDNDKGRKVILEALKRNGVQQLDWFILTHAHLDHVGGADEVLKGIKVLQVLDTDTPPPGPDIPAAPTPKPGKKAPPPAKPSKIPELPTVKAYNEYRAALDETKTPRAKAEAGQKLDLGGNAFLTILAPTGNPFREDQTVGNGNVLNANSLVARLDYGDFSMLFAGDAERLTEERLLQKENPMLAAKVLKIGHHGSKYATSERFLQAVKPEAAIASMGEFNRYGHPAQSVLDRLKAVKAKLWRTDLQGEITITTNGKAPAKEQPVFAVKAAKEAKTDIWAGREAQRDDSDRFGFIAYGDFGPPPKPGKK